MGVWLCGREADSRFARNDKREGVKLYTRDPSLGWRERRVSR